MAFAAIEANNVQKFKSLMNEELAQMRDARGFSILHLAVLRENHLIVEYIAYTFTKYINIADKVKLFKLFF